VKVGRYAEGRRVREGQLYLAWGAIARGETYAKGRERRNLKKVGVPGLRLGLISRKGGQIGGLI